MIYLERTHAEDPDFLGLVKELDATLSIVNGEKDSFFVQFNGTQQLMQVVVVYDRGEPLGCGGIKAYSPDTAELKRMYVKPEHRGRGIATQVLRQLETIALEVGCHRCILETSVHLPAAVALYLKNGYQPIPNYDQYAGEEDSLCFEKKLI